MTGASLAGRVIVMSVGVGRLLTEFERRQRINRACDEEKEVVIHQPNSELTATRNTLSATSI